jgi:D-beta-D-heptose 7-phosphate kinase/D-beta-D-heptose 1-phosphate adenosyltransferase
MASRPSFKRMKTRVDAVMRPPLPPFERGKVLVVGDIMLDRYWYGLAARISPEAPVPVVHVGKSEERPGGAANVALNTAALGCYTRLFGVTGDDEAARSLGTQLSFAGVDCHFQRLPGVPTVTKLRVISRNQQLLRLDFEERFEAIDTARLLAEFQGAVADCDVVVLSDYGKGTLVDVGGLIAAARRADKPVLVDPKTPDFSRYRGASVVTPNLAEFERVAGPAGDDRSLWESGRKLLTRCGIDALLVTRGEHGMTLLCGTEAPLHLPAETREVFDVTGAGDTVIAVLAASLAAGVELPAATALANLAAGIVVGRLGTASVSVPELRRAVQRSAGTGYGELTREELRHAVADARTRGERIVMTNGCFDLLHAGHVTCLREAKRLGDRLIVAVNDDASVARLKGDGRPLNSLERRMAVLAGLESVDWVVPFSEDTPENLIDEVRPDLLVKGGDYHPEQIAGFDCVTRYGGQVVVLGYQDGCSTSAMIDAIRQQQKLG